ncbi:MAG: 6-carboxytetrahydropterin synthase [Firmicutes bacterium]|nr:6-carboxytetrahydropterin synthase [Bacillota bacterium]MBE3590465.1 6-carboxytetrahydropterin synthase [Bacillota bacterium]
MYRLTVRRHFDASHIVEGHPGKCARLHGHRWTAEVRIDCPRLNEIGLAIDFGDVKRALDEVLPDHRHINDVLPAGYNATAERIAQWLYETLAPRFAAMGGLLVEVAVWETPDAAATYIPDEPGGGAGTP